MSRMRRKSTVNKTITKSRRTVARRALRRESGEAVVFGSSARSRVEDTAEPRFPAYLDARRQFAGVLIGTPKGGVEHFVCPGLGPDFGQHPKGTSIEVAACFAATYSSTSVGMTGRMLLL
jgi:hypothetical protein